MSLSKLPATALAAGAAKTNFGAGAVLQVVQVTGPATDVSGTSSGPILSLTITPSAASSKIQLFGVAYMGGNGGSNTWIGSYFTRNGVSAGPDVYVGLGNASNYATLSPMYLDSPATTSTITYALNCARASAGTSSWIANGNRCVLIAMEIAG